MRSLSSGSLCWIAGVCLLSGCYSPWMAPRPGYGYGSPYYSGQYMGGYQGIQTLTPGQYYAPGSVVPGTMVPNGLEPTPDENSSGSGGAGGGSAPPYNPPGGTQSRPVPTYDGDTPGAGLEEPDPDDPPKESDSGGGYPGAMSEPVPAADWAEGNAIETASMRAEPASEATEEVEVSQETGDVESVEDTTDAELPVVESPPKLRSPEAAEESEESEEEENAPLLQVP